MTHEPATLQFLVEHSEMSHAHLYCDCGHTGYLSLAFLIEKLGPDFPFPDLRQELRCSKCRTKRLLPMPAWEERHVLGRPTKAIYPA